MRRWPFVISAVALLVAFAAWAAFLLLIIEFGSCGEDSSFDEREYIRLCEEGALVRDLALVAVAGGVAAVVLGPVAVLRRSWRVLAALLVVLVAAGAAGWQVVA